jgi:hypothetical protein
MKFDNQQNLYDLKKIQMLVGMAFIALLTLAGFEVIPSISMYYSMPVFLALYVSFLIYWKTREFSFVEYSDVGDYLIFKFFKMTGFFKKPVGKMIKIPKTQLLKYEIIDGMNNAKLVLHQNTKTGVHEYPYISISAYSKKQIADLEKSLNKYVQK